MRLAAFLLCALTSTAATASQLYQAPKGCTSIATLRLPDCHVRQVAHCPTGNIVDSYVQGTFIGRSYYSNPSLFLRFESVLGRVTGHRYGPEAPGVDLPLNPGDRFTYSRDVERGTPEPMPGDTGTEEMEVIAAASAQIGGRSYRVLDIRFTVTNDDGYLYRERALMLRSPALTLGVIGSVRETADAPTKAISTIPEAISLEEDPDFRGFDPAPSCLPVS